MISPSLVQILTRTTSSASTDLWTMAFSLSISPGVPLRANRGSSLMTAFASWIVRSLAPLTASLVPACVLA